ncbi:DUF6461 domain-containing protein [Streptomyces cavernicola]|uniref:DUF6461 domain-containing protein n=1 Tax=Streptomyces cavernicola TaxID=3043613 RepID=A0ABT6S2T7_9ACTN|nr:DUF6461 domain-containing protein [Streptomyces sp. B-S-A6]MDI3402402.1 DUF6461 domain-containing protein [Streptomyces sp. B-S-A6]
MAGERVGLAWIAEWHEVHCLTLVEGLSARELLRHLGCADDAVLTVADEEEVDELDWGTEHYWDWGLGHAGVAGDWAFVLETSSFWGSIAERIGAASAGTRAVCCYSVDLRTRFAYWEDGELIADVQIVSPHGPQQLDDERGLDPARLREPLRRVGERETEAPGVEALGLALLQEMTGVEIGPGQIPTGLVGKVPAIDLGPEGDTEDADDRDGDRDADGDGNHGDGGEETAEEPGPPGTWGLALPAGAPPGERTWGTGVRSGGGWGGM